MAILWSCPHSVESYAAAGHAVEVPQPACPACGGATGPWAGYWRHVRDSASTERLVWVARVRCRSCRRTDALLPSFLAPWRIDVIDAIGRAIELAAAGLGFRRIAALLGRPETTVRGWLRRATANAAWLSIELLAEAVRGGWSSFELPVAPLARLVAAAGALRRCRDAGGPWSGANRISGGTLLARNTDSPLAAHGACAVMAAQLASEVRDGP